MKYHIPRKREWNRKVWDVDTADPAPFNCSWFSATKGTVFCLLVLLPTTVANIRLVIVHLTLWRLMLHHVPLLFTLETYSWELLLGWKQNGLVTLIQCSDESTVLWDVRIVITTNCDILLDKMCACKYLVLIIPRLAMYWWVTYLLVTYDTDTLR